MSNHYDTQSTIPHHNKHHVPDNSRYPMTSLMIDDDIEEDETLKSIIHCNCKTCLEMFQHSNHQGYHHHHVDQFKANFDSISHGDDHDEEALSDADQSFIHHNNNNNHEDDDRENEDLLSNVDTMTTISVRTIRNHPLFPSNIYDDCLSVNEEERRSFHKVIIGQQQEQLEEYEETNKLQFDELEFEDIVDINKPKLYSNHDFHHEVKSEKTTKEVNEDFGENMLVSEDIQQQPHHVDIVDEHHHEHDNKMLENMNDNDDGMTMQSMNEKTELIIDDFEMEEEEEQIEEETLEFECHVEINENVEEHTDEKLSMMNMKNDFNMLRDEDFQSHIVKDDIDETRVDHEECIAEEDQIEQVNAHEISIQKGQLDDDEGMIIKEDECLVSPESIQSEIKDVDVKNVQHIENIEEKETPVEKDSINIPEIAEEYYPCVEEEDKMSSIEVLDQKEQVEEQLNDRIIMEDDEISIEISIDDLINFSPEMIIVEPVHDQQEELILLNDCNDIHQNQCEIVMYCIEGYMSRRKREKALDEIITLQSTLRHYHQIQYMKRSIQSLDTIQSLLKSEKERKQVRISMDRIILLESIVRGRQIREKIKNELDMIVQCQSVLRGSLQRRLFMMERSISKVVMNDDFCHSPNTLFDGLSQGEHKDTTPLKRKRNQDVVESEDEKVSFFPPLLPKPFRSTKEKQPKKPKSEPKIEPELNIFTPKQTSNSGKLSMIRNEIKRKNDEFYFDQQPMADLPDTIEQPEQEEEEAPVMIIPQPKRKKKPISYSKEPVFKRLDLTDEEIDQLINQKELLCKLDNEIKKLKEREE